MATFNLCTRLTAGLAKLYRSIEPPLSSPSPPALPRLPVSPTPTAYASEPRAPALQDDVSGDSDDDVEETINLIPIGSDHSIPSPVSQARDSARDLSLDTPITTIVPPKAPLPKPKAPRATPTLVAHRYRIERPLGKGTFGSIFLATDTYYQPWYTRHVTLKFVAAEHEAMARTEYKRLRWINSQDLENTVPILRAHHAFYTDMGDYCLVMDCLMGGQVTLNPIADPFPTTSKSAIQLNAHYHEQMRLMAVRKIAVQILSALALLNRIRLAHTDLKPENILRESSESLAVKLIDFGNAVAYEDFGLYYYDFEIQTLAYRAPEVLFGIKFDQRIDMWSLGCILCELFLDHLLFAPTKRHQMVRLIADLLGPFPTVAGSISYATGTYSSQYQGYVTNIPLNPVQRIARLSAALGTHDPPFLHFVNQLLAYDPTLRPMPHIALHHPFLQPLFPFTLMHQS